MTNPVLSVIPSLPLTLTRTSQVNTVYFGDSYQQRSSFVPLLKLDMTLKFLEGNDYVTLVNQLEDWQGFTIVDFTWDSAVPARSYFIDNWVETPQRIVTNTSYAISQPIAGGGSTISTTDPYFTNVVLLVFPDIPTPPTPSTAGTSVITSSPKNIFDIQLSLSEVRRNETWQPPSTTQTLNLTPTYSARIGHKYKYRGGIYRDSTEIREADGINNRMRNWSITREALTYAEFLTLDNFLYNLRGSYPFRWSWLSNSLYTCSQWKFEINGNNFVTFSGDFMEVFG